MRNYYETIKQSPLWSSIAQNEFESILDCMEAKSRSFNKGDYILFTGDPVDHLGVVVFGSVKVIREDYNGDIVILTELGVSDLFGEVFACAGVSESPVTVQASEKCEILFINFKKVISLCSSACTFHTKLVENMLKLIAEKNLQLNQKIEILSKRSTRDKLLAFFDMYRGTASKFSIPYNREELAQYLCVDRSALSSELSRMQAAGIIKFQKNKFEIL